MTMKTWILVGALIDGTGRKPQTRMAVGVAGDRIAEIRSQDGFQANPEDRVWEHQDCALTPGLIDTHVHLTFDHDVDHATTRRKVEESSLPALALRAARNAQACLQAGVTTVRECGDRGLVTLALRDAIKAGMLAGPRILAAGTPITTTAGHLHWCGCEADTAAEVRKAARALCKAGVDFVKIMASGGNMTSGSIPLKPQYSTEEIREAVNEAHRLGRRVAAHVLNAESVRRSVAAGVDTLEHCLWHTPEGPPDYDEAVVAQLADQERWVGVTMTGQDRLLLPAPGDGSAEAARKLAALREKHADTRRMWQRGVRLMVSSDAGVRFTRFEDFALSLACAVEGLGISPLEAIHMATQVPAEAVGLSTEIGTIEVGKRADLVLVDGNPADNIADMGRVRQVWRDGRLMLDDGGLLAAPLAIPLHLPEER